MQSAALPPLDEEPAVPSPWHCLRPDVLSAIVRIGGLSPNEVACSLLLVDKATAALVRVLGFTTVHLSKPAPHWAYAQKWGAPGAMRALPLSGRRQLLCLTAASGDVTNLELAAAVTGCPLTADVFTAAVTAPDHADVTEWLQEQECRVFAVAALEAAGRAGKMKEPLFESIQKRCWGDYRDRIVGYIAAAGAGYDVSLQVSGLQGACTSPIHLEAAIAAAAGGHADVLRSLLELYDPKRWGVRPEEGRDVADCVVEQLRHVAVRLLEAMAEGLGAEDLAALYSAWFDPAAPEYRKPGWVLLHQEHQLERMSEEARDRVVRERKSQLDERVLAAAAGGRSAEWRVKLVGLEGRGHTARATPENALVASRAAACPDALQRLTWLHERGYPVYYSRVLCETAAAGNTAALAFVLGLGGAGAEPSDGVLGPVATEEGGLCTAAQRGHLACLQLLHAAGCHMTTQVAAAAAAGGQLAVLAWLLDSCEVLLTAELCTAAARGGSVELLSFLRRRGCPWGPDTLAAAAEAGCEAALEYMVAEGCPMPADDRAYAAPLAHEDLLTLRCLRRLGCPFRREAATFTRALAARRGLAVLDWLSEEGGCPVEWEALLERCHGTCVRDLRWETWLQEGLRRRQERQRQEQEAELAGRTTTKKAMGAAAGRFRGLVTRVLSSRGSRGDR